MSAVAAGPTLPAASTARIERAPDAPDVKSRSRKCISTRSPGAAAIGISSRGTLRATAELREEAQCAGGTVVGRRNPGNDRLAGRQEGGLRLDAKSGRRRRRPTILGPKIDLEIRGDGGVLFPAVKRSG